MSGSSAGARLLVGLLAALLLATLAWDLSRPPLEQVAARFLLRSIDRYQRLGSPLMEAAGVQCRFTPTCSHYAAAVIRRHGALGGTWRATWRIVRCGPWTPAGTVDPPR